MNTSPTGAEDLRPRRQILDRIFRGSTLGAGALILIILGSDRVHDHQQVASSRSVGGREVLH